MKRSLLVSLAAWFLLLGGSPAHGTSPDIVISQVYGGGGNSGATYTHDFVELHNRGTTSVPVDGWVLQYASAGGSFGSSSSVNTTLTGSVAPGGYLLIQEGQGAGGTTPLPAPDVTDLTPIAMSATSGKVRILRGDATVADLVGYGSLANQYEGSGPAPQPSNTAAALRKADGAADTDDNAADFVVGSPNPRNSGFTPPPPPPPGGCSSPATHQIAQVQGSAATTPLSGQAVRVEGVVTGDFEGGSRLNGFFVQDDTPDGDPSTSDGIFIPGSPGVSPGDRVLVSGTASESSGQTVISQASAVDLCGTGAVAPQSHDLPRAPGSSFEPLEGVLVEFPEPLAVTEHFQLGRFGEVTLASDGRLFQPTGRVQPGAPAAGMLDLALRRRLLVDDGSNLQNPPTVPFASPGDVVRIGDTATGVTGVLSFAFGSYRLQPTAPIELARTNPRPAAPAAVGGDVRVASFNALNYFTTLGSDDPEARGADTPAEFQRQQTKLVAAITGLDADVVGLMEVENNGSTAIQALVDALNASAGPGTYAAVGEPILNPPNRFGGQFGTDAIKVALIYRPAAVVPVGASRTSGDPVFDRPPLIQEFETTGGSRPFTVAVNHFKSKNCGGAVGPDQDQGDGQSCFNARRVQQAEALADALEGLGSPDPLIIGDLNAYSEEDPVHALEARGYTSLSDVFVGEDDRYSYVFDGYSGELDHAMAGAGVLGDVTGATIWHINADEARMLDYNTEFNPAGLYEPNAYRSSDHDPLIVGLDRCDTTPPTLEVSATPTTLFPPDHRHRRVTTTLTAADGSEPEPTVALVGVTSNQPDDAPGGSDGNTSGDIVRIGDTTFGLRAERDPRAGDRVYTLTYEATDACGNTTTAAATVTVPVRP